MRIVIYLGHPAQYHFFKNIIQLLRDKGHVLQLLVKTKDVLVELLKNDNEEYINILPEGRTSTNIGILFGLVKRDIRLFRIVRQFKPDLMLGSDPSLAHVGKILDIPVLTVLEDDHDVIPKLAKLTFPYTNNIIAPDSCDCGKWNYKKISYAGFMKLAYLHPNYFTKPNNDDSKIFLIRLSKLDAHHDFGVKGFTKDILIKLINKLENIGVVKILNEGESEPGLEKYLLNIMPSEIHNYLSRITLLISDSQSMSMEAAMLGIPSIRFSDFAGRIGVLEELENTYKLTFGIKSANSEGLFNKLDELLSLNNLNETFENRRQNMLKDKIDVTAFFVWLIDNYPNSIMEFRTNPTIQYHFK